LQVRGTVHSLSGGASRRIALRDGDADTPSSQVVVVVVVVEEEEELYQEGGAFRTT